MGGLGRPAGGGGRGPDRSCRPTSLGKKLKMIEPYIIDPLLYSTLILLTVWVNGEGERVRWPGSRTYHVVKSLRWQCRGVHIRPTDSDVCTAVCKYAGRVVPCPSVVHAYAA